MTQYEIMRKDGLGWQPISRIGARLLVHSMNRPAWPRGRCGVIDMYEWRLRVRRQQSQL